MKRVWIRDTRNKDRETAQLALAKKKLSILSHSFYLFPARGMRSHRWITFGINACTFTRSSIILSRASFKERLYLFTQGPFLEAIYDNGLRGNSCLWQRLSALRVAQLSWKAKKKNGSDWRKGKEKGTEWEYGLLCLESGAIRNREIKLMISVKSSLNIFLLMKFYYLIKIAFGLYLHLSYIVEQRWISCSRDNAMLPWYCFSLNLVTALENY